MFWKLALIIAGLAFIAISAVALRLFEIAISRSDPNEDFYKGSLNTLKKIVAGILLSLILVGVVMACSGIFLVLRMI